MYPWCVWGEIDTEYVTDIDWSRTDSSALCVVQEVPENGADVAHLSHLHGPIMTAGVDLRYTYNKFWSFAKHSWQGKWNQDEELKHVGVMELNHTIKLFGFEFPLLDMKVMAHQVGFGLLITISSWASN